MYATSPSPVGLMRYLPMALATALVVASFVGSPRPAATGPVATALQSASSSDRAKLRSIYGALADIMARDTGRLITTTAVWRSIYSDALRLAAGGTDLVGKYPGLDTAVEEVYAPGKWNSHLSDDVAAFALAHNAVDRHCSRSGRYGWSRRGRTRMSSVDAFQHGAYAALVDPESTLQRSGHRRYRESGVKSTQ